MLNLFINDCLLFRTKSIYAKVTGIFFYCCIVAYIILLVIFLKLNF